MRRCDATIYVSNVLCSSSCFRMYAYGIYVFIELDYILTTQLKRKTLYKLSIYVSIITREEVSSYLFAFTVKNSTLVVSVAVAAVLLK